MPATAPVRVAILRAELARRGLNAFILPRYDAHQGEYIAPHDERLRHVTGFSGSAGMAIVTADDVALFVDGRYTVQAAHECAGALFSHHSLTATPPDGWLRGAARSGWRVGCDPWHLPPLWFDRFEAACTAAGAELVAVDGNPVDAVWPDQPPPPAGAVTRFPEQLAGQGHAAKRAALVAHLQATGADVLVETQPDNIAWFLNLRGSDVAFNPMPHSFLMADRQGRVVWYVDPAKVDAGVAPEGVGMQPPSAFLSAPDGFLAAGRRVLFDPAFSPVAVRRAILAAGAVPVAAPGWITLTKAVKNPVELEGLRACHLQDGIALTEFAAWLAREVPARAAAGDPLTEREAEDHVLHLRRARPGFLSESFNSISAAAGNASMCHYATAPGRNAAILPENPYLLDSGGQYETGTTDATRSYSFGKRPPGYDRAYTAVFKAFHALATLRFPPGTQGHHIDAICRRPLWDLGLDYDHGTGHGIGHRLSVHEHPQRIGRPVNPVDLKPGMVMSIEPGCYEADRFGIRIENLFEIVACEDGFMEFRNLTWAPIQTDMLIAERLSDAERAWLVAYNREVAARLAPHLGDAARTWLEGVTA
ncbi:MAG: aminopeptidase P family protein [Rubellimicrobium sp.]|nr:aminopeptidase P family protein [Rubellimicrobium sp.]